MAGEGLDPQLVTSGLTVDNVPGRGWVSMAVGETPGGVGPGGGCHWAVRPGVPGPSGEAAARWGARVGSFRSSPGGRKPTRNTKAEGCAPAAGMCCYDVHVHAE